MTDWKKLAGELPYTLAVIFLISAIGLGIAHPELFHVHKIQHIVSAIANLVSPASLPG